MRLIVAVALFLASFAAPAHENPRDYVHSLTRGSDIFCSAVVLAPGFMLTAAHCVSNNRTPALDGGTVTGGVIASGDDRLDLATLAFSRGSTAYCPCVRLADSEAKVDEPVYVIGFPLGMAQVITTGTSQGVHDNAAMPYGRRLIVTAPVIGGNSGGGVFVLRDGEFQLVGILVEGQGHLGFAIPLVDIRAFLARPV